MANTMDLGFFVFSTTDNLALLKGAKCTATSLKYGLCNTEEEFDFTCHLTRYQGYLQTAPR